MKCRWEVKEIIQDSRNGVYSNHKIVAAMSQSAFRKSVFRSYLVTDPLQLTDVYRMKDFETTGPNPEIGRVQRYSHALQRNRYFIGTNSFDTNPKLSCADAPKLMRTIAPIIILIVVAVAATMQPISASVCPAMKNHRRLYSN